MPARRGLCTRFLNRVSRLLSVSRRAVVARRAENVKSSTEWLPVSLSDALLGIHSEPPVARSPLVVLRLILLDELLHADGIGLLVAMAFDRAGSAGRLDVNVGKHHVRIDPNRRDVRHVHRVFEPAEPL